MTAVHALIRALTIAVACAAGSSAQQLTLAQMDHRSWTAREGAPQGISALAEAPDGSLWVGSINGLFRFDGRSFEAFQPLIGEPELPSETVLSLLVARDSALWIGFLTGAARLAHGHVTLYPNVNDERLGPVAQLSQAADGTIWALSQEKRVIRFGSDGRWRLELSPMGRSSTAHIGGLFIDSGNTLWLAQDGRLYRRHLPDSVYFDTKVSSDYVTRFAESSDGTMWMTGVFGEVDSVRAQRFDRTGRLLTTLPATTAISIVVSSDGTLLVGTQNQGLRRFRTESSAASHAAASQPPDTYRHADGLSSDLPLTLLRDVDGNIWVGGLGGLDRFRTPRLTPFIGPNGNGPWAVCADNRGEVWIMSRANQVYRVAGGAVTSTFKVANPRSLSCGADGVTRVVDPAGILRVRADRLEREPAIAGMEPNGMMEVVATPDHTLFARLDGDVPRGGLWRYKQGRWARHLGAGLLDRAGSVEYIDSAHRLWVGYRNGQIGLPLEGRLYSSGKPGLGVVNAILETSHGLFATGTNGLGVFRDSSFQMLEFADRSRPRAVAGMVESRSGDLWLNAARGIVHVRANELRTASSEPRHAMQSELVADDHFVGPSPVWWPSASASRDADGTLWFAMLNGVVHFDPEHPIPARRPPILSIRSIMADGAPFDARRRFHPKPLTVAIQYLGVQLSAPERVTYRHRLDGLDDKWQDAGGRTEAVYTRLGPGTYTFRVMASNGDGQWTTPVSSMAFTILPTFYQTNWFVALGVAAAGAMLFAGHRARVRQLERRAEDRKSADEALAKLRAELAHAIRVSSLATLTASIAHEVNQPLSGVVTNAGTCLRMLSNEPPNVSGASEAARRLIRDGNRAADVITRLRALFSRKAPESEPVDLNDATREVIALEQGDLRRAGATLRTELPENLPVIMGDRVQLQQVIINLLRNACEAVHAIDNRPREIEIRIARDEGERVCLSVRDSGVGFDADSAEKLFDAFYTTKHEGMGVGLSVCRSIIENHGGRLWAMVNDGPGVTFAFSIPVAADDALQPSARQLASTSLMS